MKIEFPENYVICFEVNAVCAQGTQLLLYVHKT